MAVFLLVMEGLKCLFMILTLCPQACILAVGGAEQVVVVDSDAPSG